MIGIMTGNNVLLVPLAALVVVKLHQAVGGVDGGRAAAGVDHMIEVAWRQCGRGPPSRSSGLSHL